jgi:hypothetical protein
MNSTLRLLVAALALLGCKEAPSVVGACPEPDPCNCPALVAPPLAQKVDGKTHEVTQPEVELPDECSLYHLADQYEPALFNHTNHVEYAADCETCHHHSSEVEGAPPCRECHGETSGDLRKPGLKGAYHRQCMNCHREMGAGPLDCVGCHAKATGGPVDPEARALASVGEQILLGHLADEFGGVQFKHRLHSEVTDSCSDCHHHEKGYEKTPPCRECHNKPSELKQAYHEQCLNCHRTTSRQHQVKMENVQEQINQAKAAGHTDGVAHLEGVLERLRERGGSPLRCKDCHLPKKAPKKVELGHVAKRFGPVEFDHAAHVDLDDFCTDCHHSNKNYGVFESCRHCHGDGAGATGDAEHDSSVLARDAYHGQCVGCHKEQDGPVGCSDCHAPKDIPKALELKSIAKEFGPAAFDHAAHVEASPDCMKCHHGPQSYKGITACGDCHKGGGGGEPMGLKEALHKQCIDCHKQDDQGPTDCEDCHPRAQ